MFNAQLLLALVLAVAGTWTWIGHGRARDLGRGSDVLGYDAAQYAVAARELAEHGRLATPFALPVELDRHASAPWPLSLVQPGLLVGEALIFKLSGALPPARLGWLVLIIPFICYLGAALGLATGAYALLSRYPDSVPHLEAWLAALVIGLAFLLDPEAQHYATGGFTELPFTAGLAVAIVWLAGVAAPPAFRFGLLLGLTGLFRGNMLWLAPVLAMALAMRRPAGRTGAFARTLAGYAVVLLPWWIYKWAAFGTPAWDLSALSVWDGVEGRSWFGLNHLPSLPVVPHGMAAVTALAAKLGRHLPALALQLASGPRTLWIAGLAITLLPAARPRPVAPHDADANERAADAAAAIAAKAILVLLLITLLVTALTVPLLRYLLPMRVVAEAAGLLAVWGYLWRLPDAWAPASVRRGLCIAIALLALGWGMWQSARGLAEASAASEERGVPSSAAMTEIAAELDRDLPHGEPVMSNLGPVLAWYSRRPVVHLALTPGDVDACRERLDVREIVLVFRDSAKAWPGWDELLAHPDDARHQVEWNIARVRRSTVSGGFTAVWLELGPLRAPMARLGN